MLKKKRILVVIPARGGSKGIKLKNIFKVNNVPLISYTLNFIKSLSFIDDVFISTDSKQIKKVCENHGFEIPFFRPKSISGDRIPDISVLIHAIKKMERLSGKEYDIVLMLPPTSPLRSKVDVIKAVKKIIDLNLNSVWSVSKIDKKFHPYKQLLINGDKLNYFDEEKGKKIIARQQLKSSYIRNGVCYVFKKKFLLKYKSIFGPKTSYIKISQPVVNIDSMEDIKFFEKILNEN
jgi:CMP-N-acetylneuraminic acid synthetase